MSSELEAIGSRKEEARLNVGIIRAIPCLCDKKYVDSVIQKVKRRFATYDNLA